MTALWPPIQDGCALPTPNANDFNCLESILVSREKAVIFLQLMRAIDSSDTFARLALHAACDVCLRCGVFICVTKRTRLDGLFVYSFAQSPGSVLSAKRESRSITNPSSIDKVARVCNRSF